ncbi:MAG: hypothetical protein HY906_17760 [Deltaproteobacteria bacterium]|nr:hypothetical protein [Deltaproteobacteria bacterium]
MSGPTATARPARAPRPGPGGGRRLPLVLATALWLGCSESTPVTVSVAVVGPEGPCTGARPALALGDLGATSLRLTVTGRGEAGATPALVCDEVVDLSGSPGAADFRIGLDTAPLLDLLVEAFDASQPPRLVAAGTAAGLNRTPRLQPLRALLAPAARFGCTPGALQARRAFHTATLLPSGEILVVGGVTHEAPSGAPAAGSFWLTGAIEVYDPGSGTFRTVAGEVPGGRALHTAVLLQSPGAAGPFDLLLMGGLTARTGGTEPALRVGGASDALPLVPGAGAAGATALVVRYYPWSEPPEVHIIPASPALAARALHAAGVSQGQVVLAGGLADPAAGLAGATPDFEVLPEAGSSLHRGPFALQQARVGAVAAPLAADRMLVFGGNLGSADAAAVVTEAAEVITLGDPPGSATATFEAGSLDLVASAAHATLTPIDGGLLLVGGLAVLPGTARATRPAPLGLRLTRVGDDVRIDEVLAEAFEPVAYHAAAPLHGGDVLVTGGAATDCPVAALCPSDGAHRYSVTTGALARESWLVTARLAHSLTVRDDGSVLVAGGLGLDGASLTALADVEVYVRRSAEGKPDRFGRGAGQVSDSRCQR